MRSRRKPPSDSIEAAVLTASRRRCCLCVFLSGREDERKGQIAHLNRDRSDSRFENLAFLCFEHHDEYDRRPSQAKAYSLKEVTEYRDRLYTRYVESTDGLQQKVIVRDIAEITPLPETSEYEILRRNLRGKLDFTSKPWRYPLWQVANQSDFFAYKAGNRADGVCLIERIDLPDSRIVIACIQMAGNPGNSITNCVEALCFQFCERFDIPAERLVWLENYDYDLRNEWTLVTFKQKPPKSPFQCPEWATVTTDMWRELRLKPRKHLRSRRGQFESKLRKLFHWPTEAIL